MADKKPYRATRVDEEDGRAAPQQEQMPDLASRSGGLPVVLLVVFFLAAGGTLLAQRMLAASSAVSAVGCAGMALAALCGIGLLVHGTFERLRERNVGRLHRAASAAALAIVAAAGVLMTAAGLFS